MHDQIGVGQMPVDGIGGIGEDVLEFVAKAVFGPVLGEQESAPPAGPMPARSTAPSTGPSPTTMILA